MTLTHTHTRTRTHTTVDAANPYLTCDTCRSQVIGWHSPAKCGCQPITCSRLDVGAFNFPCGHTAGAVSVCPSWGPVDGCTCEQLLGSVPHGPAPEPPTVVARV